MVINRDIIRMVKSFNNDRLRAWLQEYGYAMYQDGKRDALLALALKLHDEFNFTNDDIARLLQVSGVWLDGAQAGTEIKSDEIKDALLKEKIYCLHNI